MGQVLLQSKAALCHYKVGQELLQSGVDNLLQSVEIIITKWATYYKVGQILQSGLGITNWGQSFKKWGSTVISIRKYKLPPYSGCNT